MFGTLLLTLRQQAGITQQSDLARLMQTTQQTVSRWEAGVSRPRDKHMPLLASVLKADLNVLLTAAGYTAQVAVATFDQPFPVEFLSPESFERFCLYFLAKLYPTADVHRVGGSGHTQEGIDIDAIFPDQSCYTFQCKRVQEFGPAKVHLAVAKHKRVATQKRLLLTRVASPQARQAIREHADWDIWDKEDISLYIRELPKEEQLKLVDTFFRGQRLALLGETEPGPWYTSEAFFAPFMSGGGVLSHAWRLVGRAEETRAVIEGLANDKVHAMLLVGAGGTGKSRVLKEAIQAYESDHPGVLVRFLVPTEEVTQKDLEALEGRKKVLVIDDAHDRSDLQALFWYASILTHQTTLLLSCRPYGLDYIKAQASTVALAGERVAEVRLKPLSLAQATTLATQVLEACGGPIDAAKDIADRTLDCPLVTVLGAQVVAKERTIFTLAKNEETFRTTLLGKFRDIIVGNIGNKHDTGQIKKLLRILALLQPFHADDKSIFPVVESVEGLRESEVSRLIRLLMDAGVLFKRRGKYRLSPDMLADYIIEDTCLGHDGGSTGYAEQVFEAVSPRHIESLLLNLGKLDWQRAHGDPSNSRLLDGVWAKLRFSGDDADAHIRAVTAVAYYQPTRALQFAEHLIREGQHLHDLPTLIKYAAYNIDDLPRACACLWELGKNDHRVRDQYPGHAVRMLAELCAAEPNKPVEYNAVVVKFGLFLLDQPDSWGYVCTPFDILEGMLRTEWRGTELHGLRVVVTSCGVFFRAVSELRRTVIDAAIALLRHTETTVAVRAARFLRHGLRYPWGTGEEHAAWTAEFVETLQKIVMVIKTEALDSLVLIELSRSVSWHAHHAQGDTAALAQQLLASLPDTLEFRTTLALCDGYAHFFERLDYEQQQHAWQTSLATLTHDLLSVYSDGECLRAFIEQRLVHIEANSLGSPTDSFILYGRLVRSSAALARATVHNALTHPESKTKQFAGQGLTKLFTESRADGLDIARRFLASESPDLHAAVGQAYSGLNLKDAGYGPEDLAMLREICGSRHQGVASDAVRAIRTVAKHDQRLAIALLKSMNVGMSSKIANEVLVLFLHDDVIPFYFLAAEDIAHFLTQLMALPELDGYWIATFLSKVSKHHAMLGATFFMDRVDYAAHTGDWHYRPCNHGPDSHTPLRFRESPEGGAVLRQVVYWMKSRGVENALFRQCASELFEAMFRPFDDALLSFFQDWMDSAAPAEMQLMSYILREASPDFVLQHRPFVTRFLEKAKQCGQDVFKHAERALYRSAIRGLRSRTFGEPFPRDLQMQEEAEKALRDLSPFSPAYRLYESLKQNAKQEIDRTLQEREAFEE